MSWDLVNNFILAMVAILNPVGIIPVWRGLTGDENKKVQKRNAFLVTLTGLIILLIFLIVGKQLLILFSIELLSFQVAGGILLLLTGIKYAGIGRRIEIEVLKKFFLYYRGNIFFGSECLYLDSDHN